MNKRLEINGQEQNILIENYIGKVDDYCVVFFEARNNMESQKTEKGVLNLNELNEIFKNFNLKKQELIDYYSSLEPDKAKEYLTYLSTNFATSSGPQKRCIGEVIAGINNYILNNYKA